MANPTRLMARLAHVRRPARVDWKGVYARRDQVPRVGSGFDGTSWVDGCLAMHRQITEKNDFEARARLGRLPAIVVAMIRRNPVRFLDFGGGAGYAYYGIKEALPQGDLEYHLVERPELLDALEKQIDVPKDMVLHRNIDEPSGPMDVVYCRTALQYADDPYALLTRFARLGPQIILLEAASIGDVPDFYSAQLTVRGSAIPYAFLNRGNVIKHLADLDYEMRLDTPDDAALRQGSLPPTHRIERTRTMLFTANAHDQ